MADAFSLLSEDNIVRPEKLAALLKQLNEHQDIKYVSEDTATRIFDRLDQRHDGHLSRDEFEGLVELFKPIMHLVMLVWKHSHHYNTPGRIVVLMRQICNDLIMQSQKFLPGGEIFGLEPPEAVEKLKLLLNVLGSFKSFYFEYKGRTTRDTPQNPWKFQNSALFARLDAFLERCHDILDLTQTALQFNKLERVEVGGTKGKALSANVRQIHADFEEALEKLHQVSLFLLYLRRFLFAAYGRLD